MECEFCKFDGLRCGDASKGHGGFARKAALVFFCDGFERGEEAAGDFGRVRARDGEDFEMIAFRIGECSDYGGMLVLRCVAKVGDEVLCGQELEKRGVKWDVVFVACGEEEVLFAPCGNPLVDGVGWDACVGKVGGEIECGDARWSLCGWSHFQRGCRWLCSRARETVSRPRDFAGGSRAAGLPQKMRPCRSPCRRWFLV